MTEDQQAEVIRRLETGEVLSLEWAIPIIEQIENELSPTAKRKPTKTSPKKG